MMFIDFDGTLWIRGYGLVDNAKEFLSRLEKFIITTNSSGILKEEIASILSIPEKLIYTPFDAFFSFLKNNDITAVYAVGNALRRFLIRQKIKINCGPVAVGYDDNLCYKDLLFAFRWALKTKKVFVMSDDLVFPVSDGPALGVNAIAMPIYTAARVKPLFFGKTSEWYAGLLPKGEVNVVIGDNPNTDGKLAKMLNAKWLKPGRDFNDLLELLEHPLVKRHLKQF